jgi:general secretion pathway protein N
MKVAVALLFAFGCLIAALAVFLPATLVDRRLDAASAGKVRLADAAGTLWRGRGVITDAAGTWRVPVAWGIPRSRLVRGVHEVVLQPVDGAATPQGTVELVNDGIAMRNVVVEVPAQALASVLPARGLPVFGGTIAISSPAFAWNAAGSSGALDARWRAARLVAGDAVVDLGAIDLRVTPTGTGLAGHLTNNGGDVRIEGNVSVAPPAINVEATITPASTAPASVARALAALGTPDAGGSVRVAWRGTLR